MATRNDDINWLYGKLKGRGYNIGTQEEFANSLANDADRQWYYEKGKAMGLELGSMDDFNGMFAPQAAEQPSTSMADTPAMGDVPEFELPADGDVKGEGDPVRNPYNPTRQEKMRTSYDLHRMLNDFNEKSKERLGQVGRITGGMTPEGRKGLKSGRLQAQLVGAPTRMLGLTPPAQPSEDVPGDNISSPSDKPVSVSGQSPVPYGVKYVEGKPVTEWLLPDGSLTTSLIEADQAEYGARTARLRRQFEDRMKQNGLDPGKQEDVQKQEQLDYEDTARGHWERRMREIDEEIAQAREEVARLKKAWEDTEGPDMWQAAKDAFNPLYGREGSPENASKQKNKRAAADAWHTAERRLDMLLKARERYERGDRGEKASVLQEAWYGISEGTQEIADNPLGFNSGATAMALRSIKAKVDKGEKLTKEENGLVDAYMFNLETENNSKPEGATYRIAKFIPEAAEMAVEFSAAPGAGLTRKATEAGLRKVLSDPRLLARAGGAAITEGASIASTTQSGKNLDEAVGRTYGAPIYDTNGNVVAFEGDPMGVAMLKTGFRAVGSNAVFLPTTRLGEGIMRYLDKNAVGKGINDIFRNTADFLPFSNPIDGLLKMKTSELLSVGLGDESFGQWADPENNAVLIGSLLASEFAMGAPRKIPQAYRYYNLGRRKVEVKQAYNEAETVFGRRPGGTGILRGLCEMLMSGDDARATAIISELGRNLRPDNEMKRLPGDGVVDYGNVDPRLSRSEWVALTDVTRAIYRYKGEELRYNAKYHPERLTTKEPKKAREEAEDVMAWEVEQKQLSMHDQQENNYAAGQEAFSRREQGEPSAQDDIDAIALRMQEAYQGVVDAFGAEVEYYMFHLNENPWGLLNDPDLTVDQRDAVLYYINSKAALDGVMDASNEVADRKRNEVQQAVEKRTHKDNGVIIPATMKVDDRQVYIVKGDVVMYPDGTGVDVHNSSESIVVMDAQSGEYEFTSSDQIMNVSDAVNPQDELDTAMSVIEQEQMSMFGETLTAEEAPAEEASDNDVQNIPENGNIEGNNDSENIPADTEAYDRGYEQGIASTDYTDEELSNAIEASRSYLNEDNLDDFGRGRLEGLEYEQQRRAMEAQSVPNNAESVPNPTENAVSSPSEAPGAMTNEETPLSRIPLNEQGEPMFEAVDKDTAWDGLVEAVGTEADAADIAMAQVQQATADLEALKKKPPTRKATKLKGSPMAMAQAKREAAEKYQSDLAEYNQQVADMQARLDVWNRIVGVYTSRNAELRRQQEEERRQRDAEAHDAAVARFEEERRIKAEKQAEQERVGVHAVNPKIKEKWDTANKIEGNPDAITLPDGSAIRGRYVLTEAGAASASHDVNNAYEPTEGFPVDTHGQSVNDRDYLRDKDAQRIVEQMADAYDNRALQTPVIVSQDGVVLSGNNRTMSGDLAARQGTDKAYVDYLREFGQKYGFTPEQVAGMKNPRLVFVPDEALPYDATTFSRFNAQEMKSQSKPEAAVKLGKIVPDNVFNNIVSDISRYDRLADYYADEKAVAHALGALMQAGVINDKQMPEMRTGTALSAAGKELIENTLIGKVFQTSPDAVRQILSVPTLRQSIVMGLGDIAHNRTLSRQGYDLSEELSKAVDLVTRAKAAMPDVYTDGMPVSPFGRMQGLFDDEYGDSRVTDATTLLLADLLNSGRPSDLRKVLTSYNNDAAQSAGGQADIFTGEIPSKETILKDVIEHFRNATPREQQALVDAAIAERKRRAVIGEAAWQGQEPEAEQRGRDQASEQVENADERGAVAPVATVEPTEAQLAAGNYKKEHRRIDGYNISIENPKGSVRRGKDADGKEWQTEMHNDYGYIRGTEGVDGDHIDVFLSDTPEEGDVFVIDQRNADGSFDEHKVMYGFPTEEAAREAYLSNYEPGWTGLGAITQVSKDEFKKWVQSSKRKTKPFSEYKSVKAVGGSNAPMPADEIKPEATPAPYTITPSTYTNKAGKTTPMHSIQFSTPPTYEQRKALAAFAREKADGRKSRGWCSDKDTYSEWLFRSEEDARKAGEMIADQSGEAVADAQPMTAQELREAVAPAPSTEKPAKQERKPKKAPINRVSLEDVMTDLSAKGETQLSDHAEPIKTEPEVKHEIPDDEMLSLANELRDLLGIGEDDGDAGLKFRDPGELTPQERQRIQSAGIRMAMGLVERGTTSFSDYATKMVGLLGDKIRPWLKSFYEGARWTPGYENIAFTPSEEVARFDVQNFDKAQPNPIAQAAMIVEERKASTASAQAQKELTEIRNNKRKKQDEQTSADTAALTSKAEAVARKAESLAKTSEDTAELNRAGEEIDQSVEEINEQLALLGYYEAVEDDAKFHESYGYMLTAEKKAVADATSLAKQLVNDLGIDLKVTSATTPLGRKSVKKGTAVRANLAPAGGDVIINLPLNEGRELAIYIGLEPVAEKGSRRRGDNLAVERIMYRVENPNGKGYDRYGNNNWANNDVTYAEFLRRIKYAARGFLPEEKAVSSNSEPTEEAYHGTVTLKDGREAVVVVANHVQNIGEPSRVTDYIVGVKGEPGTIKITPDEIAHAGAPTHEDKPTIPAKSGQSFPNVKDTEAVSKWLDENSEAIWKGVDAIMVDARQDANLLNTYRADNPADVRELVIGEYIDKWIAERVVEMMNEHPATVKAWFDYGQRGLIADVVDERMAKVVADEAAKAKAEETHNGYRRGDEVMWDRNGNGKWEKQVIKDFDEYGNPILDSFGTNWISEVGDWERIKPADGIFGEAKRVATQSQADRKKSETPATSTPENPTEKIVEVMTGGKKPAKKKTAVKPEQPVADLFGGLFDEPISDEKKTDVQPRPGTAERERGHEPQPNEPLGESQRNEVKPTDGGGMVGRDNNNPQSNATRGAGVSEQPKKQVAPLPEAERKNVRNNHAERGVDYAPKGEDARIKANIEAIELAKRLLDAGETATPEQMEILRKFSGWGGLGKAFNDNGYNPTTKRLRDLLGEDGYNEAVMSRNSAYFTPAPVIDAMWDVARALGFKGGNVLEGSAGIGNILGLMPTDISELSNIHAVEIDRTTGGILSLLYPDAKVDIQGFERTKVRNNSVDLAITNVPFVTGLHVKDDTGDKDLSKKFRNIHDFCIAKNIRKLREGGLGIFITSSGTMDNSKELRRWITNEGNADVIGAFRMHNKTFGGTGATSDIIVVRKRVNGKPSPNAIDVADVTGVRVVDYDTGETRKVKGQEIPIIKPYSMTYNKYFVEHPENMAGEMLFNFERGETRFPTSRALFPSADKPQEQMLSEWAARFADMKEEAPSTSVEEEVTRINEKLGEGVKEGSMVLNSQGELCMARMGEAVPLGLNKNKVKGHTKAECFEDYTAIKKALSDVLEYQSTNEDNAGLEPLLKELNRAFDTFTKKYGNLHKNPAISFLRNDVDFSSIMALETYSERGDKKGNKVVKVGKTDIFSRRVIETEKEPQPTTIKDGILASLYKSGGIDVDYISQSLGKSAEEVKQEIVKSGLGYENPSTGAMEVSYQYLSGNVRAKLHIAQENNEDGRYDANIAALEKVIPMTIPAHLIEFALGSSWIEPKLYEDFVYDKTGIRVKLTNVGGTWFMKTPWSTFNEKNRAMAVTSKMCDKTIMGHELIEAAITNRQITVSKQVKHYDGTTETISDKAATAECSTKIDEIRSEFKDWARGRMQTDPEMSARIEQTYNEQFNNYVPMSIPDEFVPQHFGGQVTELHGKPFALRPHQGRAVVRGTTEPILLAHEVGTGKTYTLITTAMEMRRLGTARKPMIVVQNATVGQFVESAKEIYPNAKVLTIEEADRTAEGRKNFYAKIKYNDWDMIVVPQSVFERIPDSPEREMAYIQDIIEEKMKVLEAMREADDDGRSMIVRQAEKELEEQRDRLAELTEAIEGKKKKRDEKKEATTRQNAEVRAMEMLDREVDDVENFDDMGIDAILVDEAHEYKHLGFATAMQRGVKGVDPSFSKKSQGVYLKTQAVMERNNGRNVVFATGTPISNTAAEIWTFMRYLMPADQMKAYDIFYFDDFVRNFGNLAQMVEFKTNGKFAEVSRFAGYVNLPELVRIWSGVADTVLTREAGGVSDKIPEMEGGKPTDIYLPQTRALRSVMKYVKAELDRYDKMTGKEKKENSHIPLTMYGIAKAAAVDARLVIPNAEDDPNSKTNATVRETLRSLKESAKYKGTVAIFSDNYQNKRSGFNLYEEIRNKLIAEGVPAEQIVVIKSGMTVKKKLDIFDKVNAGEIRVILGSTFTLGTGVNIQERLHTLIHVDAPNRPMDYTQRNGRAMRQGNLHKDMGIPVRIIRFGVEDSLDVTAYQRLKTKGAIADSIMNGSKMMQNSMENRVLEEEEDTFGDMTAQLSGSEYAILKNQAEREVRNLTAKQKGHDIDQIYVHNQLPKVEGFIKGAERRIEIETKNLETIGKHWPDGTIKKITIGKLTFDSVESMEDFFKDQNAKMNEAAEKIREGADNWTSRLTIDVDGLPFEVTTTVTREVDNAGQGTLSFEPERKVTYSCEALGIKDRTVKGNRIKNVMQEIAERIVTGAESRELLSRGQNQLAHYSEDYRQLQARNGKEFEHKQQLAEAKERLAKYEELMKKELEEKEAKYAEMDKAVDAATDMSSLREALEAITLDDDGEDTPTSGDGNKYRLVEQKELLDFLDGQPLKLGYRYSQWANMGALPPMTAKQNGEWRAPMIFSRWEQSEEGMRKDNGKADLVQGNGRTTGDVAYNPYFHIRTSPLNDQFTAAYDRPELLVVEGYYPESEEESGYRAEGAKDSVGLMDWHSGSVNGQLSDETKVQTMLSRYFKPSRIVPWSEVADLIMERVGDQRITFPINAVPPMLRAELAKRGAKFGDISGSVADADIPMLNDLRDRVNAGEWDAGLERAREYMDAYESSSEAKEARVEKLSADLHTPIRVISDQSEIDNLPTRRERRAKGWWSSDDNGVVVVLPNNVNVADVDNTVVHEVVGHKGLRALIGGERFDEFLREIYSHASDSIRKRIDKMTDDMVNAEADRLRVRKSVAHERAGEDVNAHFYPDMAEARTEAEKKREQFRKEATEEYMADLGGRIGSEGFAQMSRDELTLWGKIKAKVQQFLDRFLQGLGIAKSIRLTDKDLSYILYKSWKNLREKGVFADAADAVMRRRTGWDDMIFVSEKHARIAKLRKSEPVEISGNEIEYSPDIKTFKKNALEYGKTLQGEYVNDDTGRTIQLQRGRHNGGLKEVLQHDLSDKAHIQSIAAIPEIIRKSIFIEARPNIDPQKNPDVRDYEHYVCGLRIGEEDYTVHSIVASDKVGNRYYDHKLSHIEKGRLLDFIEAKQPVERILTPMSGTEPTIRSERKIKELISLLQIADEGAIKRFRDPGLGLEETITKMKTDAMTANKGGLQAKRDAMKAIGGNLNHLRQAMARQREYDITTVKSVSDLARVLMEAGLLDDLSKYETKRILGAINNVVGKQDVSQYVQKVMDIMVDNQLRLGANTLGRLLSIRGSRVDARGIEVQGELDPEGQRIAQVVRKSTSLPKDDIDKRIADALNRMGSADNAIADEATIEYAGLQLARQYVEDITESKAEEKELRDSIKQAKEDKDAGQMTEDAYKQYVEATNDAIRQNKIDRAEAFHSLVEQVGDVMSGSIERAKAWREAEKQRVEEIHHNANSDMEGTPTDEHHKDDRTQKIVNNSFARFLLAPLATFDQMLRMFGKKNTRGEGYLWNRYMRGWVEASEKEYTGYREAIKVLDDKVREVFAKTPDDKAASRVNCWGDLFSLDRKLPNATVRFWDGGEMKDHELTQGNLLYIYMADKMSDGRMKLRRMGITEEDVTRIKNFLDPRFVELADWMQDEFLVDKRNEYNEVHKRMFGASMAAIESYFPLKILANARLENVDVADETTDNVLPATSAGSIIKRRRNNLALDVTGANAFSVILDHLQQMERWAAFAEFNRDLNTLLSYKRFRNQVMNMSSVYGAGKTLWNNFRNVCAMAAGAYRPPIATLDKSAVNIAKGVTAAKVSFRLFTALKQFLSMPAYLSDSNPIHLATNLANPVGAWKWCMENLPLFEKRWKSRMAGDPRLLKTDMDWKMWRSRVVEMASRVGMSPNAFVDALTVAIGTHAMYQTKLAKYKRQGYDPDVAEERAKQDATILFNQTQQSSEGAFLSTMQVDRSWLSVLFTVFRNSSMSYIRQLYDAMRNIGHRLTPGYKGLSEEFMAKQMRRDGIDPDQADRNTKREYRRGIIRDLVRVGVFGYVLQFAWNLGAYLPYLILGDNDEEKDKMMDDVFNHSMFGSIEGLTGGDVMSAAGNMWLSGEGNPAYLTKDMPLASDVLTILKKMDKDQVSAMNDVINLCVQSGLGVNPQSLTDAVTAVIDFCGDDAETSRECALLMARVFNCPQSQIDKIYFDELDASAREASKMTPSEIAERYARYKMLREAPLTGWMRSEADADSIREKKRKKVLKIAKEKMNSRIATEETKRLLGEYDEVSKRMTALNKLREEDIDAYRSGFRELRDSVDMSRYRRVRRYKRDMEELTERYQKSKSAGERDSIVGLMFGTRDRMLEDLMNKEAQ
ncbi:MAG: hypothetical protein K2M06_04465 [Muribaculaceae bacterium]|nr:hypothetical protein [Muribaculaceae bacterium]